MQLILDPYKRLQEPDGPMVKAIDVGSGPIIIRAGGASYCIGDTEGALVIHISDARSLVVFPTASNAIVLTIAMIGDYKPLPGQEASDGD